VSLSLPPTDTNYLLFSDVHLGADLVQHARPWTVSRLREVLRIDRELSGMLDHYRQNAEPGRPWKLIIAGDLVDFMGMSIAPRQDEKLETPLTDEEHMHGLGSTRDHAQHKMRAVAERHDLVFRKLAEFVADGHSLVLIRGNHDVDFYWETARDAFTTALLDRAGEHVRDPAQRAAFQKRVDFRHWFYYVEGLLYVEHGHQYDETCAYRSVLSPLSPADPKRIAFSFSDILMRFVVRPTRGMGMSGHDGQNMLHYVRMAFAMGLRGALALGYRYLRAALAMMQAWREHVRRYEHDAGLIEHELKLGELGERVRVSLDKLRALAALSARPVNLDIRAILRSLFLDLAGAIAGSTLLIAALLWSQLIPTAFVAPLAVAIGSGIYMWIKSSRVIDQCAALREGALRVVKLFPARFVVMGHTHAPAMEALGADSTYVNLGGWAVDDLDLAEGEAAPEAPRTHLVIRHENGEPRAELRRWNLDEGPSVMHASGSLVDSGVHARPVKDDERAA